MGRRTIALGVAAIGAVAVGVLTARGLRVPSRLRAAHGMTHRDGLRSDA
jgi:hypothetical protein